MPRRWGLEERRFLVIPKGVFDKEDHYPFNRHVAIHEGRWGREAKVFGCRHDSWHLVGKVGILSFLRYVSRSRLTKNCPQIRPHWDTLLIQYDRPIDWKGEA